MRKFTIQNDNDANDSFVVKAIDVQDAALEALNMLGWRLIVHANVKTNVKAGSFYVLSAGKLIGPFLTKKERNKHIVEFRKKQHDSVPLTERMKCFKLDMANNVPRIYQ